MTRYSVLQQIPVELLDDPALREARPGWMADRLAEEVNAAGYEVTSDVTFRGPQWSAFYLDLEGQPHTTFLSTRYPNVRGFPCPRCHALMWRRCVTVTGKTASRYHKARYPAVFAGYIATAETSREA